jgi:hypothetical protein
MAKNDTDSRQLNSVWLWTTQSTAIKRASSTEHSNVPYGNRNDGYLFIFGARYAKMISPGISRRFDIPIDLKPRLIKIQTGMEDD